MGIEGQEQPKSRSEQLLGQIKNAETLADLAELVRQLGEQNDGIIDGVGGELDAEQMAQAIENGNGGNVAHSAIQERARWIKESEALLQEGEAQAEEILETAETEEGLRDQMKGAQTRAELADTVRKLGALNNGMIHSRMGELGAERMAQAIENGNGGNVSDPEIQRIASELTE